MAEALGYQQALFGAGTDRDEDKEEADLEEPGATDATSGRADTFADTSNVDRCCQYLNQTLASFGFPSPLPLQSPRPEDAAQVCNCLYAMLQQRHRDVEFRDAANEQNHRLFSDVSRLESKVARLQSALESKERELATLVSKEQKAVAALKVQLEKLQLERDEFQRMVISLQQRQTQMGHELRKREAQYVRLQDRLNTVVVEKKKESSRAGIEIMNLLQKEGRQRAQWNGKKGDGDFYKMIVDSYESKKQELTAENAELKSALRALQNDMRALLNANAKGPTRHQQGAVPETPLRGRMDVFDMPFGMAKDQIEHSMAVKMSRLKERFEQMQSALERSADGQHEAELEEQLAEARSLIQEQEQIIQMSIAGGPTPRHSSRIDSDSWQLEDHVAAIEEDRAALEERVRYLEQEREGYQQVAAQLEAEKLKLADERKKLNIVTHPQSPRVADPSTPT